MSMSLKYEPASEPQVRRNHRLRIGRYNQHTHETIPMDKTPVEYLQVPLSHGARPVHLIITMIMWIRTSGLSIENSLSLGLLCYSQA